MGSSKFNTVLTVLLIIAIIAIIVLIGYFGYSVYNKYYIDLSAKEAVSSFEDIVGNHTNKPENNDENNETNDDGNIVIGGVTEGNTTTPPSNQENNKLTFHGYNVIGTISIPAIKLECPILEKVTTNSLKYAVAYLRGAGINKPGNTVIQGHNYRNGLFFSDLSKLSNGDPIYITDTDGVKIRYEVYRNFSAEESDTSFYNRDTAGKREITLSTCTSDKAIRTIILAKEVDA